MSNRGKQFVLGCAAVCAGMAATPSLADTRGGVNAWNAGDYREALREFEASAAEGDSDAQFNLGQAYRFGLGVPRDLARAESHYAQAAIAGNEAAADLYGVLLFQRGAEAEAVPYLRDAARRGDAASRYFLGLAHFNGDVVERDWPLAFALVSLARDSGLAQAGRALTRIEQHLDSGQLAEGRMLSARISESASPPAPAMGLRVSAPGKSNAALASKTPFSPAPVAAAAPAARRPAPVRPAPERRESGEWKVQLGAFGVPGNVGRMWHSVADLPELAGRERIEKAAGKLTILQAGGYATRADAGRACASLKRLGHDCLVTR